MRIDLVNSAASQISSEPGSQAAEAQNAQVAPRDEDRATLVSDAGSVSSLVSAAMSSPEIRRTRSPLCSRQSAAASMNWTRRRSPRP